MNNLIVDNYVNDRVKMLYAEGHESAHVYAAITGGLQAYLRMSLESSDNNVFQIMEERLSGKY